MIVYDDSAKTVDTIGVLFSRPDAIRKMAIVMLAHAAEFNTHMICDLPEEYETKEDMEVSLKGINESALGMLEDHIRDLRRALEDALQEIKFTARVRRLDYDEQGRLNDLTVDISVE